MYKQFYRARNPYGFNKNMKKNLNFPSNQRNASKSFGKIHLIYIGDKN